MTAMHICFGCAAIIHQRPTGYLFLPEPTAYSCQQVSQETAQSNLDCAVRKSLLSKKIGLGVPDLNDVNVEPPERVAVRIRRALPYVEDGNVIWHRTAD